MLRDALPYGRLYLQAQWRFVHVTMATRPFRKMMASRIMAAIKETLGTRAIREIRITQRTRITQETRETQGTLGTLETLETLGIRAAERRRGVTRVKASI